MDVLLEQFSTVNHPGRTLVLLIWVPSVDLCSSGGPEPVIFVTVLPVKFSVTP